MLQFTYPSFLWGMLLAIVPAILHFLNWHKPSVIVFPSIRFLERTQIPHEGRHHPRDVIIMLLRMSLIALFMLMLARPRIMPRSDAPSTVSNVCIVDCSASMSGWGHGDKAVDFLKERINAGDTIIFSADTVIAKTDFSATNRAGNHFDALLAARQSLSPGGTLTIISDFRRNDWDAVSKCMPESVKLDFKDCGSDASSNVGISSVRCNSLANGKLRVLVMVENFSNHDEQRTITVNARGQVRTAGISLPPNARRRIPFVLDAVEDNEDEYYGIASLEQDDYALDDKYYFALNNGKLPRALVIGKEEASYIAYAMKGAYQVNVLEPIEVMPEDFKGVQAVFVSGDYVDLSQVPKDVPLVVSGAGNQSLRALRESGRLYATSEARVSSTASHSLGIGKVNDNALKELFGPDSDLFLYRIPQYLTLKTLAPSTSVVLESLDGAPLLLKDGNCSFFAFPFENFVLCSSFLPLLRELTLPPKDFGIVRSNNGEPGVYRNNGELLEINVPLDESRLDRVDLQELAARIIAPGTVVNKEPKEILPYLGIILALLALALLFLRAQKRGGAEV